MPFGWPRAAAARGILRLRYCFAVAKQYLRSGWQDVKRTKLFEGTHGQNTGFDCDGE